MGLFAKTPEPASAVRKDLYKMGKVIGAGSYGRVKKAVVKATGEAVAVKSMYKRDNADPDSVAAIKREIGTHGSPNLMLCPCICRYPD